MSVGGDRALGALAPASAPLVGREAEVAALTTFLGSAASGSRVLLIEGEAGIGKTTLFSYGLELARNLDLLVLTATPAEAERQLTYTAVGDLIEQHREAALADLPSPQRRALEVALLLREPGPRPPDSRAVALALLNALDALARERPLLVALDDVQWLDRASAAALEFVLRRLTGRRISALLSWRTDNDNSLPLGLARSLPDGRLERLRLEQLSTGALGRVLRVRVGTVLPRPLLLRVHRTTGGNPFFALELAAALREHEGLQPNDPLPVPGQLRELVAKRLERLSVPARTVLLAAALLARPTRKLLVAATPFGSGAIDEAIDQGVIDEVGHTVRVSHPLLASIVHAEARSEERRRLHSRLAELVPDSESRALHLAAASDDTDSELAAILTAEARKAKARGASESAGTLAEEALRLTPPDEDLVARTVDAASYYLESGRLDDATRLLRDALGTSSPGPGRARLLLELGQVRQQAEGTTAAIELYEAALAEAGEEDALRAAIHQRLASVLFFVAGPAAARPHAQTALRLAEELDDPVALALSLATAARVDFSLGRGIQYDLMDRAIALEESCPHLFFYDRPSVMFGSQLNFVDEPEKSRARWRRLIDQALASEEPPYVPLYWLSLLEHRVGNWGRAKELADECLGCALEYGQEHWEVFGTHALAMVAAHRGEQQQAEALIERCGHVAEAAGQPTFIVGCHELLGFLALSHGDAREARDQLAPGYVAQAAMGVQEPGRYFFLPDYIDALVSLGELDEAERWLDWLELRGRRLDRPWALAAAGRSRGLVQAAHGSNESAIEALEAALEFHARLENPFELAKTLLVLGTVQRRANRRKAARESLQQALDAFASLGASLWAEKARAELARIGGRAPAPERLTPVEHRVAALVAEGRTNREAASALHLSERTVEGHLSRVYAKLGVRSRVELARTFERS